MRTVDARISVPGIHQEPAKFAMALRVDRPVRGCLGMTTRSGPTLILEAGPTPGCGQLVGAPPFEAVVTRRR